MAACCCARHRHAGSRICLYCRRHGSWPPERLLWSGHVNGLSVSMAEYFTSSAANLFLIPAEHVELVEDERSAHEG
jgi:hypothetical protein